MVDVKRPLSTVIFDVDGTLVDSNHAHAEAWHRAMTEAGIRVPYEPVFRMIGMGGDKLLARAAGLRLESEPGKLINGRRKEIFQQEYLPGLKPFPQVRALFQRVQAAGLKIVIASASNRKDLDKLLTIADVSDLIAASTSSDDVKDSKPDPNVVHEALEQAGARADEVLMVGDTPYDIEAAALAGVRVIALRCGGWGDEHLSGALAVYDDPADLLAHFESSALGASLDAR